MAKRKKITWDISVSYDKQSYWEGGDDKIKDIVGKEPHGSGMALFDGGTRDLQFAFDTKEEAKDVAKKIRSKCRKFVKSVKIYPLCGVKTPTFLQSRKVWSQSE